MYSNPVPTTSSQRGVPYDPAAAAAQRTLAREKEARQSAAKRREIAKARLHAEAETPIPPRKQHAIYLDQVEHAWRERVRDRGRS